MDEVDILESREGKDTNGSLGDGVDAPRNAKKRELELSPTAPDSASKKHAAEDSVADLDAVEMVHHPSKKRKKRKNGNGVHALGQTAVVPDQIDSTGSSTKPVLRYTEIHRLNSMVKVSDLQNLALYCIADDVAPQWISVQNHGAVRKVVVLLVPGLEKNMFTEDAALFKSNNTEESEQDDVQQGDEVQSESKGKNVDADGFQRVGRHPDDYLPMQMDASKLADPVKPLAEIFDRLWPIKAPGDERFNRLYSPIQTMLSIAIPKSQDEKKKKKSGNGPPQATLTKDTMTRKRTRIASFLATNDEMHESDYVLHPTNVHLSERAALLKRREQNQQDAVHGWVDSAVQDFNEGEVSESEIEQGSIVAGRTVYTIDCEMCLAGEESVLTRISMVDWDGEVVLDELVKPEEPITNYLTQYSGMTEEKLADVTTTLKDIQARLLSLLHPRTILAGHSLESDLRALKLTHPFIVDTSFLYPHPRGPPLRSSLKWLTQKYLGKEIQKGHGSSGHDSVEDARATLSLIKKKCEHGPEWGTQGGAQQESIIKRISRARGRLEPSDQRGFARNAGAIVDPGTPDRTFNGMATYYLGAADDAGVVEGVQRAVKGDADGAYIPGEGVDFTWARLRQLETLRGWATEKETIEPDEPDTTTLNTVVASTVACIAQIHASLPSCTLFIVYNGTGDPRPLRRLQEKQRRFRREYATKKWDELSVQWTDTEEQALRKACNEARKGVGFVTIT